MDSRSALAAAADAATFDLAHLSAQTGGDPWLQRDLLELFVAQAASVAVEMRRLAAHSPLKAAEAAHRLQGSALAIGAHATAEAAARAQSALAAGAGSAAALAHVATELGTALSAIEAHLSRLPPRIGA